MKARDVMVAPVITVKPYSTVREVAKTLVGGRISAVLVVDDTGKLVGIISEGDLMHRAETGTERRHRWWIRLVGGDASLPADYIKAHARKAADIMTRRMSLPQRRNPPSMRLQSCWRRIQSNAFRSYGTAAWSGL